MYVCNRMYIYIYTYIYIHPIKSDLDPKLYLDPSTSH